MGIKERARQQLNWLEKVLHWIPGFKGYYERELRRDSDKLQREFVVEKLRAVKAGLSDIMREVSRQKRLELLTGYDEFARMLEKLINEVRYADRGYSGFFDLIKIKEAELDRLYQHDAELAEQAAGLAEGFRSLADHPLDQETFNALKNILKTIDDQVKGRMELLRGYR